MDITTASKQILGHDLFYVKNLEEVFLDETGNEVSKEIYDQIHELMAIPDPITRKQVNKERDRRVAEYFIFAGNKFDFDPESKSRITGAATLAGFAIGQGSPKGYLRWANKDQDFAWISEENKLVAMDAQTCFAFGQAAATHESLYIFYAKQIKDLQEIPQDYQDDKYWPPYE